ncbi:MAG: acyl carrier protein [Firmicutes bacterium]|nr:acyl carrier protein [Bacillota bacterium]
MTNLEKYNEAFKVNFKVTEDQLPDLVYQGIFEWDSVGHMDLIADFESAFGIQMETKDVLDLTSYEKGKKVLAKYGVNFDE